MFIQAGHVIALFSCGYVLFWRSLTETERTTRVYVRSMCIKLYYRTGIFNGFCPRLKKKEKISTTNCKND